MSTCTFTRTANEATIQRFVEPVFKRKVKSLYDEFRNTLASPVFAWNSTTKRKNGSIVSDPRDAIDLGGLLDGQQLIYISPGLVAIEWEAPYTPIVFNHATVDLVKFTLERIRD